MLVETGFPKDKTLQLTNQQDEEHSPTKLLSLLPSKAPEAKHK